MDGSNQYLGDSPKMDLHNLIQGSGPMWNSKRSVPKVCIQLQGRTVAYQKSMGCLPSLQMLNRKLPTAVVFRLRNATPSCDNMERGKGKVRAL